MGIRKQAVSVRVGTQDLNNVRRLAKRLGVRDSDIIRVAIKSLLSRWAPLHDNNVCGRGLVPVFLENGNELFRHFDLDTPRLDSIINEGAADETRVELEDIQLLSMSGVQRSYLRWRLDQVGTHHTQNGSNGHSHQANSHQGSSNGYGAHAPINGDAGTNRQADASEVEQSLKQYLYEKYVHPRNESYSSVIKQVEHSI
jgi:hypothetical protein